MLFNVLVHVLTETSRHAGHADILREQLADAAAVDSGALGLHGRDREFWERHFAEVEQAALAAGRDDD